MWGGRAYVMGWARRYAPQCILRGVAVPTSRGKHTGIKKRRPKATAGRLIIMELQYFTSYRPFRLQALREQALFQECRQVRTR